MPAPREVQNVPLGQVTSQEMIGEIQVTHQILDPLMERIQDADGYKIIHSSVGTAEEDSPNAKPQTLKDLPIISQLLQLIKVT